MEKRNIDMTEFDDAFKIAYALINMHIESGAATTADIAGALSELTLTIRELKKTSHQKNQP
jgi:hypothetical protein